MEKVNFICLLTLALFVTSTFSQKNQGYRNNLEKNDNIIIELEDGKISGAASYTVSGRKYSDFKGIPYAKPPIGELRFMPPLPNEPWQGTLNATVRGNRCTSIWYDEGIILDGSEDCLSINVQTPITNFEEPVNPDLPVMVYFHGGAFILGWGSFANGYFLLDQDVILVSMNYRLNAFGFLSLNTTEVSGNQGLRDQQLALKWVQNNIHQFGGDPSKVTIFGQSAGSWAVLHHILAPGSAGLFSKAIAQSGAFYGGLALGPKTSEQEAKKGLRFANILGCENDTLACLQSLPAHDIMLTVPFLPRGSIDISLAGDQAMLPGDPKDLFQNGQFNRVPLMIGNTNAEGLLVADVVLGYLGVPASLINLIWEIVGPLMISEAYLDDITQNDIDLANKMRDFYVKPYGIITSNNLGDIIDLATDALFQYSVHKTARIVSEFVPEVYQYRFSHDGPYSAIPQPSYPPEMHKFGVSHADDLYYNFDFSSDQCAKFSEQDFQVAYDLASFFTNFARTGDPNNKDSLVHWDQVTPDSYGYLQIQNGYSMIENDSVYEERMKFWDKAIEEYGNQ